MSGRTCRRTCKIGNVSDIELAKIDIVVLIQRLVNTGQQHLECCDRIGQNAGAKLCLDLTSRAAACLVATHFGQLVARLALVFGSNAGELVLIVFRQILSGQTVPETNMLR